MPRLENETLTLFGPFSPMFQNVSVLINDEIIARRNKSGSITDERIAIRNEAFNKLWEELHTKQDPTKDWFDDWIARVATVPHASCNCSSKLAKMLETNKPRFDDWFAFTWELHNAVNVEIGNPIVSFDDAQACWLGIAPLRKPRLIITIATGSRFKQILALTRPRLEAYAKRCDADFIALTNPQFDQWQREKFRTYEFAKQYEQTLFLDSDLIVRDSLPNLFETYADADVVMHDDYGYITAPHDPSWIVPDHTAVMASQEIKKPWNGKMWNSGVVLTSRRAAGIWMPPPHRLPSTEVSEQWWVQHQAESFDVVELPSEFNWQWWFPSFASGVDSACLVHLSGKCNKLEEVRKYA